MHVCLICAEFFGWGSLGGFGYTTRMIGRELAKRGVRVSAVVPLPRGSAQPRVELDGISVIGVERTRPFGAMSIYRELDADVFHSQQPSLASWVAQKAMPDRVHLATFMDPRALQDWWLEFRHPTQNPARVILTWLYYENILVRRAIRKMDGLYASAEYLRYKARRLYRLPEMPGLLPTPVEGPASARKAETPTAIFVGRWDRVKRPELFFDLARSFPAVEFIAIGKAQNVQYENELRNRYGGQHNLKLVGYINQFESDELSRYLGRAWILVNTSAKEALPITFIEACAHRCAIVSSQNPDDYASRFGRLVIGDDYAGALHYLLENNRWEGLGKAGYSHVMQNNSLAAATQRHLDIYEKLHVLKPRIAL